MKTWEKWIRANILANKTRRQSDEENKGTNEE